MMPPLSCCNKACVHSLGSVSSVILETEPTVKPPPHLFLVLWFMTLKSLLQHICAICIFRWTPGIKPGLFGGGTLVIDPSRASRLTRSCTFLRNDLFSSALHRQAGHHELAERLVEIQYELTDRLTFYLCGRRPGAYPRRSRLLQCT